MKANDGLSVRAVRHVRKLLREGQTPDEIFKLATSLSSAEDSHDKRPLDPDRKSAAERLVRAQRAIRSLIAAGFSESDIASMVNVSTASLSHILEINSCRSVGSELAARLEMAVATSGWERLKTVIPLLQMAVIETCNAQGSEVSAQTLADIARRLTWSLTKALLPAAEPSPAIGGIHGALAVIGNPNHHMYLIKLWPPENTVLLENIAGLELMTHELEHIINRLRERRKRLEKELPRNEVAGDSGGRIA